MVRVRDTIELTAISAAIHIRVMKQRKHFTIARAIDIAWLIWFEAKLAEKEAMQ